jgi:hypothetical protein
MHHIIYWRPTAGIDQGHLVSFSSRPSQPGSGPWRSCSCICTPRTRWADRDAPDRGQHIHSRKDALWKGQSRLESIRHVSLRRWLQSGETLASSRQRCTENRGDHSPPWDVFTVVMSRNTAMYIHLADSSITTTLPYTSTWQYYSTPPPSGWRDISPPPRRWIDCQETSATLATQ